LIKVFDPISLHDALPIYTFTIAGTNPYRCIVHPSMVGTITVVTAPPACPDPSNLTASNITEDSVDISWTENGTATEWELEYGPRSEEHTTELQSRENLVC